MFKAGDVVKYGMNGVCKISDIVLKDFLGEKKKYYVLTPVNESGSTYYVPVENEALTAKMQYILSVDEVYRIMNEATGMKTEWIEADKVREEAFGKILKSNDRREIISLIRCIKNKERQLSANKKKIHSADMRILIDAENIIAEEFATVLNVKIKEVEKIISEYFITEA